MFCDTTICYQIDGSTHCIDVYKRQDKYIAAHDWYGFHKCLFCYTFYALHKSFTTSPAMISPATDGTNAVLPGIALFSVHLCLSLIHISFDLILNFTNRNSYLCYRITFPMRNCHIVSNSCLSL